MTRPFYQRFAKRPFDIAVAGTALLVLAPLLVLIAVVLKLDSSGPVLFRQQRVGRALKPFWILKLRTMVPTATLEAPSLTVSGDARITQFGRLLRRTKLDETPQLWNILRGDMSLVGPRPEVEKYVTGVYSETDQQEVFSLRPGLTDPVTVTLLFEEQLLAQQRDVESFYVTVLLPAKIRAYRRYAGSVTLLGDLKIILATLRGIGAMLMGRGDLRSPPPAETPAPRHAVRSTRSIQLQQRRP